MAIADALPETEGKPVDISNGEEGEVTTTRRHFLRHLAEVLGVTTVAVAVPLSQKDIRDEALKLLTNHSSLDDLVEAVGGTVKRINHGGPLSNIQIALSIDLSRETGNSRQNAQPITNEQLRQIITALLVEESALPENIAAVEDSRDYGVLGSRRRLGIDNLRLRNQSNIDDEVMPAIARISGLRQIGLLGTGITDDGLKHLSKFPYIRYLDLSNTAVTLDGIRKHLGNVKIHMLGLRGTGITIEEFRACNKHMDVYSCVLDDRTYNFPEKQPEEPYEALAGGL